MEVLLILKPEVLEKFGVSRLRYDCPAIAHAAFIAFNFQSYCDNIYITNTGETKPFIEGFPVFAEWYNSATIHNDILTFKTTTDEKK